ncbi:MAG TPA: type II secretion system protein [Micromonosporaceae bacterium]|jgi:type II secretory pathway pseudopilin PulG
MRRSSTVERERGETLIELLVTVVILGTAVVAVIGALMVAIRVSDLHRKHATAGAAVRAYAEDLERLVSATPTGYKPCADAGYYQSNAAYSGPAGYTPHVLDVKVWSGTDFVEVSADCMTSGADHGVQQLTLRVDSPDNLVSESLVVVIRNPCRAVDDPCAA